MVDVVARHLPSLSAELEGFLADGALGVETDVGDGDGDGGHGLDSGLRDRGVFPLVGEAAHFDLGKLVEEALIT